MQESIGGSIFASMSNNYYHLTIAEKKVADYVLSHKTETQYLSISELAEECGVADSTISRFCRKMNLRGYNDFKLAVAKAVVAGSGTMGSGDVGQRYASDGEEGDLAERSRRRYLEDVAALSQTAAVMDPEKIREAVDLLVGASRIYCMGQGGSMVLAEEAAALFETITTKVSAVADSHRQLGKAALMSEKDVILFFSYSGSTREILDLIELAQQNRVKVILITRYVKSPGAQMADLVLPCGSNEGPLQLGSVAAKLAQLYLVDVLYQEYRRREPERTEVCTERIAEALAIKHL